jgi:hypothetical protein
MRAHLLYELQVHSYGPSGRTSDMLAVRHSNAFDISTYRTVLQSLNYQYVHIRTRMCVQQNALATFECQGTIVTFVVHCVIRITPHVTSDTCAHAGLM